MRRSTLGAVAATLVCVVGAAAFMTTAPACAQQTCTGGDQDWGGGLGEGNLIDENTWESTANDAKWLGFGGAHRVFLYPSRLLGPRKIASVTIYISPSEQPNSRVASDQYTIASGNVAVQWIFADGSGGDAVGVRNDTCGGFFMRAVITAYPAAPLTDAGVDASVAADVTVADAPVDAPSADARTNDATISDATSD